MTADLLEATLPVRPSATGSRKGAPDLDRSPRRHRSRRVAWCVGGIIAVGVSAVAVLALTRSGNDDGRIDQGGYAPVATLPPVGSGAPVSLGDPTSGAVAGLPAPTSADAVTRFLDAEIAGDVSSSFAQLSTVDRAAFLNEEGWQVTHDELPAYEAYTIVEVKDSRVVVDATLTPQVNEIVGVIPGSARVTFDVIEEDGGYYVSLDDTTFVANYPDESIAAAAATAWIAARQACDTRGAGEFGGSVVGELNLAERLCGVTGTPTTSGATRLDSLTNPTVVLSAFGGGAVDWARVITVAGLDGVAPIAVVMAPFGNEWVVIGAMAAR